MKMIEFPIRISLSSQESNWQLASIGSGNGLAPNKWQGILYAALEVDELMAWLYNQTGYLQAWYRPSSTENHNDVIMGAMESQITSLTIVYSIIDSRADQRKHQSPASLVFVRGIHRWPVNSPHKWSVTWKIFPLYDVIMNMRTYAP